MTFPVIQKPDYVDLTPEVEDVLRAMFSTFDRIAIEAEFGSGFSSSRVFRVRPIRAEPPAPLPLAVKIASVDSIRREWWSYQTWLANSLPGIARLEAAPTLPSGSLWGGLRYTLAGDGVFAVQSLGDYYWEARTVDLLQVLNKRLFQIMGQQWWLDNRTNHAFQMWGDYDALLPVNLLINPLNSPPDPASPIVKIEPAQLPSSPISARAYVLIKGFVVTELDLERQQVTLNLPVGPEDQLPISYRLRLVNVPDVKRYQVGDVIDSIYGVVEATRHALLVDQISQAMGVEVDLSTERLSLPLGLNPPLSDEKSLPNPLLYYQAILQDFLKVNISTIHGDLNLRNILIDPETHSVRLIDFATARRGHVLHDLLRLETEVVINFIPAALAEAALGPETIYHLYRQLHYLICQPKRLVSPRLPHISLEKPVAILEAIRNMARKCLFDADDWTEYYRGLTLYLLGAIKFKSLDGPPKARQVAFWGAATLLDLLEMQTNPVEGVIASEDGHIIAGDDILPPPLPEFDLRFLETLDVPGGAVRLRDTFYIERQADTQLKNQLLRWGTTTTIRAPRQTGKTSLLIRGVHYAHRQRAKVIYLDFQSFGREQLVSYDVFLRALAEAIGDECELDEQVVEETWGRSQSTSKKVERLLERHILPAFDRPVILAMDEADFLMQTDFYKDFFGLLRSWHNRRTYRPVWEKLNIVLVISTEPYLLIDDIHQSPFNVGLDLGLSDFDRDQVRDLNQRHGSPVGEEDLPNLMNLLNGHPFLTRLALYTMVVKNMTWSQLSLEAPTDHGLFGRHLQHQYWIIHHKPELITALKEILHTNRCTDEKAALRLLRAGLVKSRGDIYTCRCDLYQQYFGHKVF